jgi:hypothetical protein
MNHESYEKCKSNVKILGIQEVAMMATPAILAMLP